MQIEVLGKSNSYPDAGGACSGYLVSEGGFRLLLDCGHGVFAKLRLGHDPSAVDAILISHLHPDHCLDLVPYSQYLRHGVRPEFRSGSTSAAQVKTEVEARAQARAAGVDEHGDADCGASEGTDAGGAAIAGRGAAGGEAVVELPRLPVYGPPGLKALLAMLSEAGVADAVDSVFDVHEYEPRAGLTLGPLRVSFQQVPHFVETYAVRLTGESSTLTFGADCRLNEELIEFARDSDLLILEATLGVAGQVGVDVSQIDHSAGHMSAEQAGFIARLAGARTLLITHFSDQLDRGELAGAAATEFRAPVELAYEGLQLSVPKSVTIADNVYSESIPPLGATMFKGKTEDDAEVTEVTEEPAAAKGGSPIKGFFALLGLLLVGAGVALAVSKPLREKALDKLFGAEEQFDYTPPAEPTADGAAAAAEGTEPTA